MGVGAGAMRAQMVRQLRRSLARKRTNLFMGRVKQRSSGVYEEGQQDGGLLAPFIKFDAGQAGLGLSRCQNSEFPKLLRLLMMI